MLSSGWVCYLPGMKPVSRWAVAALVTLSGIASSAFAQVEYVREIEVPSGWRSVLGTSQSPFESVGPYTRPYLTKEQAYFALNTSTGEFDWGADWQIEVRLSPDSRLAWMGGGATSNAHVLAITSLGTILTYNITFQAITWDAPLAGNFGSVVHSIAPFSLDTPISMITDLGHHTIDRITGTVNAAPLSGVDTATTHFMAYGADGLLYVLDYGNERIASFDPDNAFAPVNNFNLNSDPGTITANEQFAIGINGSFYLSDGLGGGSYYNSLGEFEGVFMLPEGTEGTPYTGQSFINTDARGNIFVYDAQTGLHQYQDTSVVPEPGMVALLGLGMVVLLALRRRLPILRTG